MLSYLRQSDRRQLSPGLALLTSVLAFGVIAGAVAALSIIVGLARHWAFAAGAIVGFAALAVRVTVSRPREGRRWQPALLQIALMGIITLLVTLLLGTRIFAPAT